MAAAHAEDWHPPAESVAFRHASLRFAVGTTGAFVLSEAMGWNPTFLAPLLAAVLIAKLPASPPLKVGLGLVIVQAAGAYAAYALTALMHETPIVLFGTIAVIILLCFANLARGGAYLPLLLVLISFATIPVVTMIVPQEASPLPFAYARAMAVAVMFLWIVHFFWPRLQAVEPPPPAVTLEDPVRLALTGTAIVMPLMLVYLMYSVTDALPILITTIVLIINFDPRKSSVQSVAMVIANFLGGMVALIAHSILLVAPSLATFAVVVFVIAALFGVQISRGGSSGAVALVTFNQAMVMFGLALTKDSGLGIWGTRLFQFMVAGIFAVGMMSLLFRRPSAR